MAETRPHWPFKMHKFAAQRFTASFLQFLTSANIAPDCVCGFGTFWNILVQLKDYGVLFGSFS